MKVFLGPPILLRREKNPKLIDKKMRGKGLFDYFFTLAEHGYFLDA
jgi:hypothetical protein